MCLKLLVTLGVSDKDRMALALSMKWVLGPSQVDSQFIIPARVYFGNRAKVS